MTGVEHVNYAMPSMPNSCASVSADPASRYYYHNTDICKKGIY